MLVVVGSPVFGQSAAVLPLPPALRDDATIVRLNREHQPEVLRKGTNGMVCIDDAANDDVFDVRCYRETFIQVVYRGFQFGYDVAGPNVRDEILSGKLQLSKEPTAGYRCLGPASGYDAVHNTIDERIDCWQSIHFPFKTAAEVGFAEMDKVPETQRSSTPYVMASGTYWSHVMIEHPHQLPTEKH
jgi:hypothetical protein